MWERVTLIDWDGMSNTITRVHNATSDSTRGVEREDGLDSNVELRNVEVLKEDLDHSFSVFLWVSWGFGEESSLIIWGDTKLFIVAMMPDLFHVVPIVDDTMFNWIVELENTSLLLSFFTDIAVLLLGGGDNRFLFRITNNGWERTFW